MDYSLCLILNKLSSLLYCSLTHPSLPEMKEMVTLAAIHLFTVKDTASRWGHLSSQPPWATSQSVNQYVPGTVLYVGVGQQTEQTRALP